MMQDKLIQAFALIDHTQPALNGKGGQGAKTPNVYFEVSSAQELRARIAGIQFDGSRVLRIYHKPGDWVLVGPLDLGSVYGTVIEQPILSWGFACELWQSALGRLALRKQQEVQLQGRGVSTRDGLQGLPRGHHVQNTIQDTAVILPFKRPA